MMIKLSSLIKCCSPVTPVIQMIGFLTWDVFKFLLADAVSLVAILVYRTDGNY